MVALVFGRPHELQSNGLGVRKRGKSKPIATLLIAVLALSLAGTAWYVKGVSGSNNNSCLSASVACKTIGHAIALASSGDSIKVAAATYTEKLTISTSLKIFGPGAQTTILDSRGVGPGGCDFRTRPSHAFQVTIINRV